MRRSNRPLSEIDDVSWTLLPLMNDRRDTGSQIKPRRLFLNPNVKSCQNGVISLTKSVICLKLDRTGNSQFGNRIDEDLPIRRAYVGPRAQLSASGRSRGSVTAEEL